MPSQNLILAHGVVIRHLIQRKQTDSRLRIMNRTVRRVQYAIVHALFISESAQQKLAPIARLIKFGCFIVWLCPASVHYSRLHEPPWQCSIILVYIRFCYTSAYSSYHCHPQALYIILCTCTTQKSCNTSSNLEKPETRLFLKSCKILYYVNLL